MKRVRRVYVKIAYAVFAITALVMAAGAGESWPVP
jgi:hypothetical protein